MRASHWSIRTQADVALALREAAPRAELVVERDAWSLGGGGGHFLPMGSRLRRCSESLLAGLAEGFWHVVWGGLRPLRRGRRVRAPPQGVSGGVEIPFEGQAAVLRSPLKCKV